jgi:GT2 family glycosyltransferase
MPGSIGSVKVSLIIVSKDEGHNLKQTVDHLTIHKTDIPYEIIVVDDGSNDYSINFLETGDYKDLKTIHTEGIGPSRARNLGANAAVGEMLVFLDAHVIPQKNWLDGLAARFESVEIYAVAPVLGAFNPSHPDVYGVTLNQKMQPYWRTRPVGDFSPLPFAGAGCLAIRKEVYAAVGGFDNGFKGIGYGDIDFCFRLWTAGFNIYVDPLARIIHKFRKSKPYKVVPRNITYNFLRLAFKNFNESRITQAINVAKDVADFGSILMDILSSDVWEQRLALRSKRKHDDDWFFARFPLEL